MKMNENDVYAIQILNLNKRYESRNSNELIFKDFSLEIRKGEKVSILGSSGCGKTTLLNIISKVDPRHIAEKLCVTGKIGYMFQTDRLLPWRKAKKNTLLGIELTNKLIDKKCLEKVSAYFKKFGLSKDDEDKYGIALSGGMKQRVALIRTLLYEPDILLLDEPFTGLDYETKHLLETEVLKFVERKGLTLLFITHDIEEAIAIGGRIVILKKRTSYLEPTKILLDKDIKFKSDVAGRDPIAVRGEDTFPKYFRQIRETLVENS